MKFFLWRVADLEALVELLPERDRVRPPAPPRFSSGFFFFLLFIITIQPRVE